MKTTAGTRGDNAAFVHSEPTATSLEPFWDFCTEVGITPPPGRFFQEGDDLLLLPAELPELSGLNVVRLGLFLGELRYGQFLPAHPLALALERQQAKRQIELPAE